MTEQEINQTIAEAMGLCWHDYIQATSNGELWVCHKCGKSTGYGRRLTDYPSYTTSWQDYGEALEWAMEQGWFVDFAYEWDDRWIGWIRETLLNPLRGSTALAEFIVANKVKEGI